MKKYGLQIHSLAWPKKLFKAMHNGILGANDSQMEEIPV
jgi:hypothetical protein